MSCRMSQTLIEQSSAAKARNRQPLETVKVSAVIACRQSCVTVVKALARESQSLTEPSIDPDARILSSGENSSTHTSSPWFRDSAHRWPVHAFQIEMAPSSEPDASILPDCENARDFIDRKSTRLNSSH